MSALTPAQKRVLAQADPETGRISCRTPGEIKVARRLEAKGLVEFRHEQFNIRPYLVGAP